MKNRATAAELEASIKVEMEDTCDWPTDMTISVQPDGDSWKVAAVPPIVCCSLPLPALRMPTSITAPAIGIPVTESLVLPPESRGSSEEWHWDSVWLVWCVTLA